MVNLIRRPPNRVPSLDENDENDIAIDTTTVRSRLGNADDEEALMGNLSISIESPKEVNNKKDKNKDRPRHVRYLWSCHNDLHVYSKSGNRSSIFWIIITLATVMVASTIGSAGLLQKELHQKERQEKEAAPRKQEHHSLQQHDQEHELYIFPTNELPILIQFSNDDKSAFFHQHYDEELNFMDNQQTLPAIDSTIGDELDEIFVQESLNAATMSRQQSIKDSVIYETYRAQLIDEMDKKGHQENKRMKIIDMYDEDVQDMISPTDCQRVSWYSKSYPNCNTIHEISTIERPAGIGNPSAADATDSPIHLQDYNITYLQKGSAREAWKFEHLGGGSIFGTDDPHDDTIVLKLLRYKRDFKALDIADGRSESIVFDQLSNAPLIMKMYGFCSTTSMLETMAYDLGSVAYYQPTDGQYSQTKLDEMDNPCLNNFTTMEKLSISLEMAESIASMHGNRGGRIIHSDVHIEQWLFDFDGHVRLNDFNNAFMPTWNMEIGDYCNRRSSYNGIVSIK